MLRQILPVLRANLCIAAPSAACLSSESVLVKVPYRSAAVTTKFYHTSSPVSEKDIRSTRIKDDARAARVERQALVDSRAAESVFPSANTPNLLFDGVPYKDLPIVNVTITPNNTKMYVSLSNGVIQMVRTCGIEGFKNARKKSNVAAQATGFTLGKQMVRRGFKTVKARVDGLGVGRAGALKGLVLGGVNIVSVTDATKVSPNPPRPRKQRRL